MKLEYIVVLIFASVIFSSNGQAQESKQLESYTPPPLFGEATPLVMTTSPATVDKPPRPIPKINPKKNFAKSALKDKQSKNNASKGIVKGPKVMPAVKKENVEKEVLFEAKTPINNIKPKETVVKAIKREKPTEVSAEKNWVLEFANASTNFTKEHEAILLEKVIPKLDFNSQSRVFIESFATTPENTASLSADRRIALSRALAVRSYLVNKEIAVSRIDLRALGEKDSQESGKTAINQVNIQILE